MRENVVLYLMVIILVFGFFGCSNDDNEEAYTVKNLIGSWQFPYNDSIITFSENIFIEKFENGNYKAKGTWGIENSTLLFIQWSHNSNGGVININDLPIIPLFKVEGEIIFISKSNFKWLTPEGELEFIRID